MAENDIPNTDNTDDSSTETQNQRKPVPYDRFQQVNSELQQLRKLQADAEQTRRDNEAKTLAEQNKWKELYEKERAESEPLRGAAEEAKRLRERIEADNLADIEQIPEAKRSLIPEYDDPIKMRAWLTANKAELLSQAKPIAPNLGGGAGGNVKQNDPKLTQEQKDFARMAGMSEERYALQLARRGQAIDLDELKKQRKQE